MSNHRRAAAATRGGVGEQIAYVHPTQVTATFRNLVLVVATAQPDRAGATALLATVDRVAAREGPPGVLIFVDRDHAPPDEASRLVMRGIFEKLGGPCAAMCICLDGIGFLAAAKRSVATLAVMSLRSSLKTKILSTPEESLTWLSSQLGDKAADLPVARLAAVVRDLAADLKAGALPSTAPGGA